jgi:hypothetical protein
MLCDKRDVTEIKKAQDTVTYNNYVYQALCRVEEMLLDSFTLAYYFLYNISDIVTLKDDAELAAYSQLGVAYLHVPICTLSTYQFS